MTLAPRGHWLTIPLWPDTGRPTVGALIDSLTMVRLDPEAEPFASMGLSPDGVLIVARMETGK